MPMPMIDSNNNICSRFTKLTRSPSQHNCTFRTCPIKYNDSSKNPSPQPTLVYRRIFAFNRWESVHCLINGFGSLDYILLITFYKSPVNCLKTLYKQLVLIDSN